MSEIPNAVVRFVNTFSQLGMKGPVEIRLADYDEMFRLQYELRGHMIWDGVVHAPDLREITIYGLKFTAPCPTCGCSHKH